MCQAGQLAPLIVHAKEMNPFRVYLRPQKHKCVFLLFEQLQLLIFSDIKNKTVKVESIIISRLARDLQISGGRIALGLS